MSRRRTVASVDAWLSPGCMTRYSVSECDEDGEITCIGGADDMEEAWDMAVERAEELGVPALLMPDETGRVTREVRP